jgi:Vacuolar protein sorting-associated protein 62
VQDFRRLWTEGPGSSALTVWEPVPPAGYVALGAVATTDGRPPPSFTGYCVRADATRRLPRDSKPLEYVHVTARRDDPFGVAPPPAAVALCVFDAQLLALRLRAPGAEAAPAAVLALPGVAASGAVVAGSGAAQPLSLHLNTNSVCVRVRSILRVPLFEVETAQAIAECTMHGDGRVQATATFRPEMWSYNEPIKTWEPMLEPVPIQERPPASSLGCAAAAFCSGWLGPSARFRQCVRQQTRDGRWIWLLLGSAG